MRPTCQSLVSWEFRGMAPDPFGIALSVVVNAQDRLSPR